VDVAHIFCMMDGWILNVVTLYIDLGFYKAPIAVRPLAFCGRKASESQQLKIPYKLRRRYKNLRIFVKNKFVT
jgi:hypothetical protein